LLSNSFKIRSPSFDDVRLGEEEEEEEEEEEAEVEAGG
jgi:hypothetical protein